MKRIISEHWNSNMAGYEWQWDLSLERLSDGSCTLSAEQTIIEGNDNDEAEEIPPVTGLRRGADIYDAYLGMIDRIGEDADYVDLDAVAEKLECFDITLADHFIRGAELLHKRWLREKRKERDETAARLARHEEIIEAYIAGLDDVPGRIGETCFSSPKARVRTYLEGLISRNEQLPSKEAAIGLVLNPVECAGSTTTNAPEGWINVPYRRASKIDYRAGICQFCGREYRARPLVQRWDATCPCGATLDHLGMAWLRDERRDPDFDGGE